MDAYFTFKFWEEVVLAGILVIIILLMILMVVVEKLKERSKRK